MSEVRELDIGDWGPVDVSGDLRDAIDSASNQGEVTWLTEGGTRVAAIVPVEVAEHYGQVTAPAGRHHRKSLLLLALRAVCVILNPENN